MSTEDHLIKELEAEERCHDATKERLCARIREVKEKDANIERLKSEIRDTQDGWKKTLEREHNLICQLSQAKELLRQSGPYVHTKLQHEITVFLNGKDA